MKTFAVIFAWVNWGIAIYLHNIYSWLFVALGFTFYFLVINVEKRKK
jgi:hypothetical protein